VCAVGTLAKPTLGTLVDVAAALGLRVKVEPLPAEERHVVTEPLLSVHRLEIQAMVIEGGPYALIDRYLEQSENRVRRSLSQSSWLLADDACHFLARNIPHPIAPNQPKSCRSPSSIGD
jgi:hypothetical protein